jgi:hypothetical protein
MDGMARRLTEEASVCGLDGIAAGAEVFTLEGVLPIELLAPGDRVVTRSGMRRVVAVEAERVFRAQMVRIAGDGLGVGRPGAAVWVGREQGILIRDWRARALYGQSEAIVPARRLCDGTYLRAEILAEARLYHLVFEAPEVVYAGGMELACMGQAAHV